MSIANSFGSAAVLRAGGADFRFYRLAALEEKGYDLKYVFGEGGHSDNHGGALMPDILRWIWRDYAK